MGYFDKTAGVNTLSGKFKYIKDHFTYYSLNSWNGLESIANNVKTYRLGLSNEQQDRLCELESADPDEYWFLINQCLRDECLSRGIDVCFNGRSSGYLVLYENGGAKCPLKGEYWDYDSYQDWLKDYAEWYDYRAAQSDLRYMIERDFEMVREFDQLCDAMRDNLIFIADHASINEEEVVVVQTVKSLVLA